MSSKVLLISCGGTFDKSKFTRSGKFVCGDPAAKEIFAKSGISDDEIEILSLLRKDSLDMDDDDRAAVVSAVTGAKQERVVIVHGTDTLINTAEALIDQAPAKTVVVVGAMRPAIFTDSDAAFNLGFALGIAQAKEAGVWVAMHGQVWPAGQVKKDTDIYRFVDA